MGMNLSFGGNRDGELPVDAAVQAGSVTYFGGQPAAITATGTVTLAKTGEAGYIGLFHNSSFEDIKIGTATVISGQSKVTLLNGSTATDSVVNGQTVEGAPYDTGLTYAAGELLYIQAATGLWQNVSAAGLATNGGGITAKAIVVKPATATDGNMEIYLLSAL